MADQLQDFKLIGNLMNQISSETIPKYEREIQALIDFEKFTIEIAWDSITYSQLTAINNINNIVISNVRDFFSRSIEILKDREKDKIAFSQSIQCVRLEMVNESKRSAILDLQKKVLMYRSPFYLKTDKCVISFHELAAVVSKALGIEILVSVIPTITIEEVITNLPTIETKKLNEQEADKMAKQLEEKLEPVISKSKPVLASVSAPQTETTAPKIEITTQPTILVHEPVDSKSQPTQTEVISNKIMEPVTAISAQVSESTSESNAAIKKTEIITNTKETELSTTSYIVITSTNEVVAVNSGSSNTISSVPASEPDVRESVPIKRPDKAGTSTVKAQKSKCTIL